MAIPRTIRTKEMFQVRVTPTLKWPHKKITVNYDSQLIFSTFTLAEKFVPYYVRELIEMTFITIDQKFEAGVIKLAVYDGTEDIV